MHRSCLLVACALLTVAGLSAQDHPDFSGEWVILEPPQDPPPVLTIVQNDRTITIEVRSSEGPSSGTYGVGTVGGVVGPIPGHIPRIEWSWKNGTLIVAREGGTMIPGAVRQEVWSLDQRGRLVVAITMRGPNTRPTTTRFVYRRR